MKFLLHGLNYAPEEIGIGKYSGEMVQELVAEGCQVTVVTTPPYYPHWQIGAGYRGWLYRVQREAPQLPSEAGAIEPAAKRGAKVIRCPLWVPRRVNGWKRIVHLASFGLSSVPVVLWQAVRYRPHVIMTVEPAAMCMPTTWLAAKLCGAKSWLHVQDFEVDAAFDLGILKQPLLKKTVLAAEAWLMRRFDRVSSISPKMVERLHSKGVAAERTYLFPNWVDCNHMRPLDEPQDALDGDADSPPHTHHRTSSGSGSDAAGGERKIAAEPAAEEVVAVAEGDEPSEAQQSLAAAQRTSRNELRRPFGIPADKCVALYAGNIGAKQGLELIVAAARRLQATAGDVHFVICGHGAAHAALAESARGLDNVQLLPVQPSECFNELMNCADIHLLPQKADAADLVMPSKLTGMLATGRAVVACASPQTQIAQVVEGRGCVVPPGDEAAFAEAIEFLARDANHRRQLGSAARRYAVEHLGRKAILTRFLEELKELRAEG